jgi:hypothetical protein
MIGTGPLTGPILFAKNFYRFKIESGLISVFQEGSPESHIL